MGDENNQLLLGEMVIVERNVTRILKADAEGIGQAARLIRAGELVAFPTETVYGLGANALDGQAVAKIFQAKGRPRFDPLIVHVAKAADAWALADEDPRVSAVAKKLADAFWPGPMTLVLKRKIEGEHVVSDLVSAGLSTVGLRVPGKQTARELIEAAGVPIAAPSANRFGGISPTRAEHVADELDGKVKLILDGGACETGVESTVLRVMGAGGRPTVLRFGGLSREAIEQVVGPVEVARPTAKPGDQPVSAEAGRLSPGMLERHYAPRTPMRLVQTVGAAVTKAAGKRAGLLVLDEPGAAGGRFAKVQVLSGEGDLTQAAANLFAAMRRLDGAGLELIVAVRVPAEGLGLAVNDRLTRASG